MHSPAMPHGSCKRSADEAVQCMRTYSAILVAGHGGGGIDADLYRQEDKDTSIELLSQSGACYCFGERTACLLVCMLACVVFVK